MKKISMKLLLTLVASTILTTVCLIGCGGAAAGGITPPPGPPPTNPDIVAIEAQVNIWIQNLEVALNNVQDPNNAVWSQTYSSNYLHMRVDGFPSLGGNTGCEDFNILVERFNNVAVSPFSYAIVDLEIIGITPTSSGGNYVAQVRVIGEQFGEGGSYARFVFGELLVFGKEPDGVWRIVGHQNCSL